ncbi:MAG TPA: glutathione peroxidase [Rariglobus sp.]
MKLLLLASALFAAVVPSLHAASVFDITVKDVKGADTSLAAYRGKVLLIVNVASKCGFTRQYAGLEALYAKYQEQGLVVLGFPCNQFGGQEPGTEEEIVRFCSTNFHVSFPLFAKIEVNGPGRAPLYTFLSGDDAKFPGRIGWNFNKFLVGRDGQVIARYESKVAPQSAELTAAIEAALAAK